MKHINDFIVEKFKLNANNSKYNKYNEELIKDIIKHFGLDNNDESIKYIEEWVIDNQINKIFYFGDQEVLEEGRNAGMPDDILDDFNTDYNNLEACQEELEKCKEVYDKDYLTIKVNKNMLAYLSDIGGLYVTNKEMS